MNRTIIIDNANVQNTMYGSYTPKYFFQADLGGYFRHDEYKSKSSGDISGDNVLVLDRFDLSPVQTEYEYLKRDCHCCFAGYAHSVNQCHSHPLKTKH